MKGLDCCCCRGGDAKALEDTGVEMPVPVLGAGDMEEKPTRSFRFGAWDPETGLGAANWVLDVVVAVEVGGWMLERGFGLGAAVVDGVADWKSSKSSSSAAAGDWKLISRPLLAGFLPFDVEVGAGSSSPIENRSGSGSFFFAGSAFLFSRLTLEEVGLETESAFRRPGAATAPSSYSSYSSNLSPLLAESWNPPVFPPKPPPSP